jgi:hypothetical protein
MVKYLLTSIILLSSFEGFSQALWAKQGRASERRLGPKKPLPLSLKKVKESPPTNDPVFIDFVGSGDIQKSLNEGKDINANTGVGIIFERYAGQDALVQSFELEGVINIATTADTILASIESGLLANRRNFGTYILNPVSAKQSLFINSNIFFRHSEAEGFAFFRKAINGANVRVIASNSTWRYDSTSYSDLGALSFRAGVFHEFIPDNYRLSKEGRSKYSLTLGVNYTYKGIFGDITSEKNGALREKFLGTTRKSYNGFEVNFGFKLNNLRAEFQMPIISKKRAEVAGLTNTQFQFSIRFIGGFSLMLLKTDVESAGNVDSETAPAQN